ncbi:MAG: methyltransferase domain-containing protein [Candidatus Brocadiaceae bacterium]|nr:methyltransferase domain-containing protein [Candidatus Brocadiaceae bacterium]
MAYEFDGKKYEKASIFQQEWGNKIISELNLKGNEDVLDLGCGSGLLTANLARLVPNGNVIGVDASEGMMEAAKERERNNLKFLLMDLNEFSLNHQFDFIFSSATLHWIKNHKRLWINIHKILKPNGFLRFNFAADGNCSHFFKAIKEVIVFEEYRKYFYGFQWPWYTPSLDEYKNILMNFAFSELNVWEENTDRFFSDREAVIRWVDQPNIVPFLEYIPNGKKELFRKIVIEQMIKESLQKNGKYFEKFRRINVFAKKRNT